MARIVLAADISGTRDGKAWPPRGSEVDLPEDEARALVASGAAVDADDEKAVARIRGHIFGDLELAGAPSGRDITEGQPDTHLARARYLAQEHGDAEGVRSRTREAARNANYTDAETLPTAAKGPLVGDDQPAPAQTPGATDPAPVEVERDGQDGASGLVEAADAAGNGEERAVVRTQPRKR